MVAAFGLLAVLVSTGDGLSPSEAVRHLAAKHHLSYLTCDLTGAERLYRGEIGDLWDTLGALERDCDLETTVWRGMIVARPSSERGLRERVAAALSEEERDLLLRPLGPEDEDEAGWHEHVVGCVRLLLKDPDSADAYASAVRASLWMAAPDLADAIAWYDALEGGQAYVAVRTKSPEDAAWFDGATEILVVEAPVRPGAAPTDPPCVFLADAGYDKLAAAVEDQHAMVSGEELAQRAAERGMAETSLGLANPVGGLEGAVAGDLGAVCAAVGNQCGCPVRLTDPCDVALEGEMRGARPEDALLAASALCGRTVEVVGEGVVVREPSVAAERLVLALPLDLWGRAVGSDDELRVARWRHRLRLWRGLSADELSGLRAGFLRMNQLSARSGSALREAAVDTVARKLGLVVRSLPDASGTVPLWFYDVGDFQSPSWVLRSAGREEWISGEAYEALLEDVTGGPVEWPLGGPAETE